MSISVVLVDDHPLFLAGVEQLLGSEPDFNVLAACTTIDEGWHAVETHRPEILVLDVRLGESDGLDLLRRLDPATAPAVIVLTALEDEEVWLTAARCGARAVVLKATAPRVLEECVRGVHRGEARLVVGGVDLSARLVERESVEAALERHVTRRELDVVRLVALGLDNQEIAERLSISAGTVKIHLHHVYEKLQVNGRHGLRRLLSDGRY
jgi:DNA-binding NarL/FixJ family response regulator